MNTEIDNNGPDRRHEQPQSASSLDGYGDVDLGVLDEHFHRIADARAAIITGLDEQMLDVNIPRSPVIERLIGLMPPAEKIALLHRNRDCCSDEIEIQDAMKVLESCSAALAAADQFFLRFLQRPTNTSASDAYVVSLVMEEALSQLEASNAN